MLAPLVRLVPEACPDEVLHETRNGLSASSPYRRGWLTGQWGHPTVFLNPSGQRVFTKLGVQILSLLFSFELVFLGILRPTIA